MLLYDESYVPPLLESLDGGQLLANGSSHTFVGMGEKGVIHVRKVESVSVSELKISNDTNI